MDQKRVQDFLLDIRVMPIALFTGFGRRRKPKSNSSSRLQLRLNPNTHSTIVSNLTATVSNLTVTVTNLTAITIFNLTGVIYRMHVSKHQ
ncbi:hypothetical protein PVK06_030408 [Gossypium arboreum]|uniref:Uncharacterized protein n=1 Tax=Gossypium arboreum TaxID=29729 RepID=A0ABR0NN97_GOSAR|nr:hypothetical protein PVK06_030408 [Gossypium arboreum]